MLPPETFDEAQARVSRECQEDALEESWRRPPVRAQAEVLAKPDGLWVVVDSLDGQVAEVNLTAGEHDAITSAVLAEAYRRLRAMEDGNTGTLTGMAKQKRGYSREFTPRTDRRIKREIDRVPATLDEAVQKKLRRVGVSLRALTLRLWQEWAAKDDEE